jgi:(1->4)-alpha-D-glucan 1-alpha-D-glucosylmutase
MRAPSATYRIQFTPAFRFEHAERVAPYLSRLGITDLYASPVFSARKGSGHGYDVTDPTRINPELGGEAGLDRLIRSVRDLGMGWIQDIVPNHMAFDGANPRLADIFEKGEASRYYRFFDIDWDHPVLKGRLIAPFLGKPYREALEAGEIRLVCEPSGFGVRYGDFRFPLRLNSYETVSSAIFGSAPEDGGEFGELCRRLGEAVDNETADSLKAALWKLRAADPETGRRLDEGLRIVNERRAEAGRAPALDGILERQVFQFEYWKSAGTLLNYRRFFAIGELISVAVEREPVFEDLHRLIVGLCESGRVNGLRVDHIDGLYDPGTYLNRLRSRIGDRYLVVEKILGRAEALPSEWPVQGTSGYEFLTLLNGLYCERSNEFRFRSLYRRFTGEKVRLGHLIAHKKRLIMDRYFHGDIDNLVRFLTGGGLMERYPDIMEEGMKKAVIEAIACFPVYRTYIGPQGIGEADRAFIQSAIQKSRTLNSHLNREFDLLEKVLLLQHEEGADDAQKDRWLRFVMRFQQLTGPLMAKGFEDTALYLYNRLLSLNEVGGHPSIFGTSVSQWHNWCGNRIRNWPLGMNATATHDTKRGEDARARINVLSEMPGEWEVKIGEWHRLALPRRRRVRRRLVPGRSEEYVLYQTLIGVCPFGSDGTGLLGDRLKEYFIKAAREAKVHTEWIQPDALYESAMTRFIDDLLSEGTENGFLKSFIPFQKKVAFFGILNSLSQTLIKITAPGVPDFYQGTELWDFSLVDPDNRRPVDFAERDRLLGEIEKRRTADRFGLLDDLWTGREDGRIKLYLIHEGLKARRSNRALFEAGGYLPARVRGSQRRHVLAYARRHEDAWAVTVAPRFAARLVGEGERPVGRGVWKDATLTLPPGAPRVWRDVLTGEKIVWNGRLEMGDLLTRFPAALLIGGDGS